MTYSSGWPVLPRTIIKRERWPEGYTGKSIPLVYREQEVVPDQPVLRISTPENIVAHEQKAANADSAHARSFSSSPTLFNPSSDIDIPSGLHGRVIGFTPRGGVVIESHAALLQGAVGAGRQVAGVLTMWRTPSIYSPQPIPPGAILVVPGSLTFALLHQALNSGVVGVVASSITLRDLEGFLRTDYLQLLRSFNREHMLEQLPPLTILLTEGIGSAIMPAHILSLLHQYQGSIALLSGAFSLRDGQFPELAISIPLGELEKGWQPVQPDITLALGSQVRICAGKQIGMVGVIDYFFAYEQSFASGIRARAVRLRLEDGSFEVVPSTLIERIS
ncbi:hypothetical protein KDW_13580 [Dictyobacter vulcani]|uniref:KOW domain-containing protein n=1 Tax=Dictyobacter vulcani TaxID=2607529 RepID=A0A5J4KPR4_9CHLR|nr:hypothetical protein [Dictyobacter vulcani]GER87196.1 hypothetical protein KDW_13580 [Dictyobacter vulcani]